MAPIVGVIHAISRYTILKIRPILALKFSTLSSSSFLFLDLCTETYSARDLILNYCLFSHRRLIRVTLSQTQLNAATSSQSTSPPPVEFRKCTSQGRRNSSPFAIQSHSLSTCHSCEIAMASFITTMSVPLVTSSSAKESIAPPPSSSSRKSKAPPLLHHTVPFMYPIFRY